MKISELTIEELKVYCGAEDDEDKVFEIILDTCKAYIRGQTGLTDEEMDDHEDLTMAAMILASDFYDNRSYKLRLFFQNFSIKKRKTSYTKRK